MKTNEILRALRQSQKLMQSDIAEKLGVSLSSYQKYERDKNCVMPSIEVLMRIADYYGVSVDYLLGREPPEQETISRLAGEFNMSTLEKKILEGYLDLPKNVRGDFMEFLHKAVLEVKEESAPDYGPMRHSATLEELRASAESEKDA
jgi:transcriptional regulator with XRE-family HTH domain